MKQNLNIKNVNPYDLSERDFTRLNEITQDMWAEWIWEFVQCKCCWKMMGKKDIFWHLSKDVYDRTVKQIMAILKVKEIGCIYCKWETDLVYGDDNTQNIKARLLDSEHSTLIVCENSSWEIVWYMDWYVDDLDTIFARELKYHYEYVWIDEIKNRVNKILRWTPQKLISFSSLWLISWYWNFFNIFEIYKKFSQSLPLDFINVPWITELDRNNNLYFIYKNMLSISLWLSDNNETKTKIANTWENYASDIVVFEKPLENFTKSFNVWIRDFLKMSKSITVNQ